MAILLAFAPFIVFAVVERLFGSGPGLIAAAIVSLALVLRERLAYRSPKILEIGSAILFAGLALYVLLKGASLSIMGTRLLVDAGLFLLVLGSLAIGVPFTLQYAREQVPEEIWQSPLFKRTNVIITAAWALALGLITVVEAVLVFVPGAPTKLGIALIIAALVAAVKFTGWYPAKVRRAAG